MALVTGSGNTGAIGPCYARQPALVMGFSDTFAVIGVVLMLAVSRG